MIRTFHRLFVEHPREVDESYFHHMAASSRFGFRLLKLASCAFMHALIPGVLTQASLLIAALLLWFSPIYQQRETAPVVVSTALCGLIIAQIAATSVLHQLASQLRPAEVAASPAAARKPAP